MIIRCITIVLTLIVPSAASASIFNLVEVDYLAPGDGLITRDSVAERDWLDLTQSPNLSYNDMVGSDHNCNSTCATGPFVGWTFATELDVKEFITNA